MMYRLYLIVQQDRLFDNNNEFRAEESKILMARLKILPRDAVVKWSEAIDPKNMGSLSEAATSMLEQDSMFLNGAFQKEAFVQKLGEIKVAKKK